MKVEHLYKLLVEEKKRAETRSDKVDPCTGPTLSFLVTIFQIGEMNEQISQLPGASPTK